MHKLMIPLAIAIGLCGFNAPQASAQQIDFLTQFDQNTVHNINSYLGGNLIQTETLYDASYWPTNKPKKVRFSVFIDSGSRLSGEGNLDRTGTSINVNKAAIVTFSSAFRLRGKASSFRLPIYPKE